MSRKSILSTSPICLALLSIFWASSAGALEVNITKDMDYVDTVHEGKIIRIQREQDQDNVLTGGFTKTSRKCPPFCIREIYVADGVSTVGEVELLEFIKIHLNNGTGILIDARTPAWHKRGTIPGSINIPFTILGTSDKNDLVLKSALAKLGVKRRRNTGFLSNAWANVQRLIGRRSKGGANWDFTDAKELLLWCNGMWCGQSPRAIKGLLKIGYPADKIRYYRGGMQAWQLLGLTVVIPKGPDAYN